MGPVVSSVASPSSAVARSLALPLLLLAFAVPSFGQEGIYADFTTSMGSFTCRLEYAYAPKTVANFIGLATGERAWLDLTTGRARTTPFYDGLIFHRVITNFNAESAGITSDKVIDRLLAEVPDRRQGDEVVPQLAKAFG